MAGFDSLHPSLRFHIVNSLRWPSLRPLQREALDPLLGGEHALLLAPTAGGKTEAAVFPLLSRMLEEDWPPLAVLYVCPLRALLDNLLPRLEHYASLLGRRVGIWHGGVSTAAKTAIRRSPPDLLLTTPESLEGLLVSRRIDPRGFFHQIQAVVVDEIHAFAGDDRGWHLLSVLGRIEHLAGRRIQRIGLSATVGNPETLLEWLTGPSKDKGRVIRQSTEGTVSPPEVELDWVGHLDNAAKVIAALHRGEKRLVFCDSRARSERLAHSLDRAGVTTWVSHGSLGRELRQHAEQSFATTFEGVMVATSTLELGIDLGDLGRVIQIDAPGTVASFLQRLGRTGRRPGSRANCLFLATQPQAFLRAAAVVQLWSEGFVEPVEPPPQPFHVLAQQLMALCLQEGGVEATDWRGWLLGGAGFPALDSPSVDRLEHFLLHEDILWLDGPRLWLGCESERRYRHRNFMELLSMITDSPLFTVFHGRQEIGQVDRTTFLLQDEQAPVVLLLAGRSWKIEHIDWRRRRCWVKLVEEKGRSRWQGEGQALSFSLCQTMRRILRGDVTPPGLSRRARAQLDEQRRGFEWLAASDGVTTFEPLPDDRERWWTFAGRKANATLLGLLRPHLPQPPRYDNLSIALPWEDAQTVRRLLGEGVIDPTEPAMPQVDRRAVEALKFFDCLPKDLLRRVIESRWADRRAVRHLLGPCATLPGYRDP